MHGDGDTKRISVFDPSTLKRKKVIRLNFNRTIKGISRKKAGRIKGVTGIADDGKYVFKYSKKKINKVRYSNMINDILFGENNYYAYLWY